MGFYLGGAHWSHPVVSTVFAGRTARLVAATCAESPATANKVTNQNPGGEGLAHFLPGPGSAPAPAASPVTFGARRENQPSSSIQATVNNKSFLGVFLRTLIIHILAD